MMTPAGFHYALTVYLTLMAVSTYAASARGGLDQSLDQDPLRTLVRRNAHAEGATLGDSGAPHHAIEQGPFSSYTGAIRGPHNTKGHSLASQMPPPDGLAQFDKHHRQVQLETLHDTLRKGQAGMLAAKPPDVPSLMDRAWAGGGGQKSVPHEGKPVAAFFGLEHEARVIKQYGLTRKDMAYVAKGASPRARECRAREAQCMRRGAGACGLVLGATVGCAMYLGAALTH